ncbi:MAG: metallophosphoesterase [Phycisphaerales bacterium]|nr:metallophosphoesterase [Phycisphaerales bacterium]
MLRRLALVLTLCAACGAAHAQGRDGSAKPGPAAAFSQILGRPTQTSISLSLLSETAVEAFVEYRAAAGSSSAKTPTQRLAPGVPAEFELKDLKPDSAYVYRVRTRRTGEPEFTPGEESPFRTARRPGATFTFALQGDSHPERPGRMFDPDLYTRTMRNAAEQPPDFYILMGDDFSIERLISRGTLSQATVNTVYAYQRGFLGLIGRSSPLFLVNGNHEQAAKYLLDGTPNNAAVYAGRARTAFYPLPAPDTFYSGNSEPVEHIGLLRDYYAWTWGDALFVVIDPYWHSDVAVDNEAGARGPDRGPGGEVVRPGDNAGAPRGRARRNAEPEAPEAGRGAGRGTRDLWQITLGDRQYQWLRATLLESKAPFKFVFSHHVLGTGRGGIEQATRYEWGGKDRRGVDRFAEMRPTWEQPIHHLMRDAGVTIFFQGHDHLYARQELDGVIYQSVPNPADPTFTAFNREAYRSGEILPNSGHLRVTVSPGQAKVEYILSFRPADENANRKNGAVAHTYTAGPRRPSSPAGGSERPR